MKRYFTSESVAPGHPDKLCDQISDSILDACLAQDPSSRVAIETLVKDHVVVLAGEITTNAAVDFEAIARDAIRRVGYADGLWLFDADTCEVHEHVSAQSNEIAGGVDADGAGDQGLMFGYACDDTPELMPMPIALAHGLLRRYDEVRRSRPHLLGPDAKSQVTIEYVDGVPSRIDTIVISALHGKSLSVEDLRVLLREEVASHVAGALIDEDTIFHLNVNGTWNVGGPIADSGLTGRKIIVDTYGGMGRHGGGAFSGKDATKVDRSAAYAARQIAKSVVASGLARRCEVQLSYAIGYPQPLSIHVETFGTARIPEDDIESRIREMFDLSPLGIIRDLDLRKPVFARTASFGHFGREGFSWERVRYFDS